MSAPAESAAALGDGPAGIPQPVLVRGTGLLGTSIGIGLSAAGVDVRLHDPSPAALAVAAVPAALVIYTVLLIPFTPSIQDIRKANLEQPAQILSADGKLIT